MRLKQFIFLTTILLTAMYSCKNKAPKITIGAAPVVIYKGLYSFGPDVKSFKECANGHEFWVADSSAQLELQYSQMGFEKPDMPVYVEVTGKKIKSIKDSTGADYDSTLVVTRLIKITKDIPKNGCN